MGSKGIKTGAVNMGGNVSALGALSGAGFAPVSQPEERKSKGTAIDNKPAASNKTKSGKPSQSNLEIVDGGQSAPQAGEGRRPSERPHSAPKRRVSPHTYKLSTDVGERFRNAALARGLPIGKAAEWALERYAKELEGKFNKGKSFKTVKTKPELADPLA